MVERTFKEPLSTSLRDLTCTQQAYLYSQDAEDYEERTTDEDYVPDRSQRRQQRLNDELKSGSTADNPIRHRRVSTRSRARMNTIHIIEELALNRVHD